jgi:hypothetical protein
MKDKKVLDVIYGLAYQCPYNKRQEDCPLSVIDGLTFREKIEWINQADPTLLESIGIAHRKCSNKLS